jgi:ketosteroid isomerase-like protein
MAVRTTARTTDIVRKVNAAFEKGDVEGFLACCADEVVWAMVGDKTVKGKKAIREWMGSMAMEPPRFTVDAVIGDGEFATAFGDMKMKEKDGSIGQYAYCDVYRFEGDKIAELRSYVIKTGTGET